MSREPEHTGGNTAKGDRVYAVFRCEVQAGRVAVCKQRAVAVDKSTADNRSYGMQHILTWQVKGRRNLCGSGRLFVFLFLHDAGTHGAQLYPREGVDAVVDARMAGLPTSGHAALRLYAAADER